MLSQTDNYDRSLFTCDKSLFTTIDHYSPATDHYSPTCVNSFQTDLRQSRQIKTDAHKSLLLTSTREKKPDRFPNRLLLINSNILPPTE